MKKKDFGTIFICAERYARGRRTYMPEAVCRIIKENVHRINDKDVQVLIDDIKSPFFDDYGDLCDRKVWLDLLECLEREKLERKNK